MQFKFHQPTYIDNLLITEGETYSPKPLALKGQRIKKPGTQETMVLAEDLFHVPGPHWEPLDEEAKTLCAKHKHQFTGEVPDVLAGLEAQLALAQQTVAKLDPESAVVMAKAIAEALAAAGFGPRAPQPAPTMQAQQQRR